MGSSNRHTHIIKSNKGEIFCHKSKNIQKQKKTEFFIGTGKFIYISHVFDFLVIAFKLSIFFHWREWIVKQQSKAKAKAKKSGWITFVRLHVVYLSVHILSHSFLSFLFSLSTWHEWVSKTETWNIYTMHVHFLVEWWRWRVNQSPPLPSLTWLLLKFFYILCFFYIPAHSAKFIYAYCVCFVSISNFYYFSTQLNSSCIQQRIFSISRARHSTSSILEWRVWCEMTEKWVQRAFVFISSDSWLTHSLIHSLSHDELFKNSSTNIQRIAFVNFVSVSKQAVQWEEDE